MSSHRLTPVVLLLLSSFLSASVVRAETAPARAELLPVRAEALAVLRVLAFDRGLERRASGAVLVAVAARPGDAAGQARRDLVVKALRDLSKDGRARGLPFEARAVTWDENVAQSLARVAVLVVVGKLGEHAADVARLTRERRLLSIGEDPALVEQGLAVAVFSRDEQLVIAASMIAARMEGIAFEPSFLRQVELLEFPDAAR